jgi:hypothetical protein
MLMFLIYTKELNTFSFTITSNRLAQKMSQQLRLIETRFGKEVPYTEPGTQE